MNSLRVKAVIVREVPVGEADKILTLLTKEYGLMTISAKNARRPKNNMLFSTSALIFGEFELFGSESTRYYLNQVTIIESFQPLRNDVVKLTYCAHIMDVVLDAMRDSSSSNEIYTLLVYTLYTLCKPEKDIDLIVHTFELKLLFLIGFLPILNHCAVCGREPENAGDQPVLFSFTRCGICCSSMKCVQNAGEYLPISPATWNCLCYIAGSTIEKLYSFHLEKQAIDELSKLSTRYICDRLERCYTKLRMLSEFH